MKAWLKHNNTPLDQVKKLMKTTVCMRAEWIQGYTDFTLLQIKVEYPRLLDTPDMVRYLNVCILKLIQDWYNI